MEGKADIVLLAFRKKPNAYINDLGEVITSQNAQFRALSRFRDNKISGGEFNETST